MLLRNQLNLFWSSHYIPTKEEEQDLVVAELSEACPLGASFSDALQFLHFWQPLQHWEHLPAGMASIYWASELSARKMLELRPARSPKNCSSATRIWKKTNKQTTKTMDSGGKSCCVKSLGNTYFSQNKTSCLWNFWEPKGVTFWLGKQKAYVPHCIYKAWIGSCDLCVKCLCEGGFNCFSCQFAVSLLARC